MPLRHRTPLYCTTIVSPLATSGPSPTTTGMTINRFSGSPAGMMISGSFGVIDTYGRLSSSVGAGSPRAVSLPAWEPRTSTTKTSVSPAWIGSPGGDVAVRLVRREDHQDAGSGLDADQTAVPAGDDGTDADAESGR